MSINSKTIKHDLFQIQDQKYPLTAIIESLYFGQFVFIEQKKLAFESQNDIPHNHTSLFNQKETPLNKDHYVLIYIFQGFLRSNLPHVKRLSVETFTK